MEGGGEEGAPTASGGTSSTHTVGSEGQETDKVGGAVVDKLGPGDLLEVLTELLSLCGDWENIGLALKMNSGSLDAMRGPFKSPKNCMKDMLREWLNTSDASWSNLVQALRHPIVGHAHLAAQVERKYLTQEHTSTSFPHQPPFVPTLPPHHSVQRQNPAASNFSYPPPGYHAHHLYPLTDHTIGYATPSIPLAVPVHRPTMRLWPHPHTSAAPYQTPSHPTLPSYHSFSMQQQFPAPSHLPYQGPGNPAHQFSHPFTDFPPSVGYATHPTPQAVHIQRPIMWPEPPPTFHLQSSSLHPTHSSPIPQHVTSLPYSSMPSQDAASMTGRMHPPTAFTHLKGGSGESTGEQPTATWEDQPPSAKRTKLSTPAKEVEELATSSHATSKPSTPDPQLGPMELFVESLMAEYERVSAACDEKLYPTPTAKYTNLAVIKKELMSRTEADKFTRTTLHGGLDEIMRKKKPVRLEDVFKPDDSQQAVNFVLVEGAPGVGKSTFALELCRRWHNIELMKRFVAVVLLRLRERRVREAKSVADLLYHEDNDIKKYVVKQVCSSSGKNLLLVLDGFDELPSRLQHCSFIAKVIRGHWFRKATILVTSRPSARRSLLSLRPHPDKHIEVMGFTSALVDQYANSVYGKDSKLLADFRTYINTNPAIKSMMYVPLNSSIVVEIYREYRMEGRPIPQTMTQLYTELTLLRIRSYLRDQCKQPLDSLPVKLEDLPKEIRDQLFSLAKLAFTGYKNKEVIFERLPDGCACLGLMTASQEMYVGKKGAVNYNFFHLTHQEFLAAFYISHLTLAEKREFFLQCLQLDINIPPEMSMRVVWRFVVGMVGLEDVGWDKYMPWLGRLVRSTLPNEKKEKNHEVTPFLAQCLYEAQEKVNWENLLQKCVTFYAKYVSPLDYFALGCCISASNWIWDLELRIEAEMLEMLVCGLKSRQEINGSIKKLNFRDVFIKLEAEGVSHLQELPHQILQGISYLSVYLEKEALDPLSRLVPTMTSMKELDFTYNSSEQGGMVNILKSLSTVNTLQTLNISDISLGPTDIMALSQLIRPSVGSVKELWIGHYHRCWLMTQEHTEMMLEAVLGPSSLESLELDNVDLYLPLHEATLLQENHNLIKLTMFFYIPGTVSRISKGLHHLTRLRELDVNVCTLDDDDDVIVINDDDVKELSDDVITLCEMIRTSQSLKTMTVYAEFRVQDVQAFVSALQDNHTLEQLHLRHDAMYLPEVPTELRVHVLDPRISLI